MDNYVSKIAQERFMWLILDQSSRRYMRVQKRGAWCSNSLLVHIKSQRIHPYNKEGSWYIEMVDQVKLSKKVPPIPFNLNGKKFNYFLNPESVYNFPQNKIKYEITRQTKTICHSSFRHFSTTLCL